MDIQTVIQTNIQTVETFPIWTAKERGKVVASGKFLLVYIIIVESFDDEVKQISCKEKVFPTSTIEKIAIKKEVN